MTATAQKLIQCVAPVSLYDSAKVHYALAEKFLATVPYIGSVLITSTWRPPGGAGSPKSFHKRTPCLALDFQPKNSNLWDVFNKLISLGWQRIGIRPDKHMIHIDMGAEFGLARPYLFLEGVGGKDLGPLDKQPLSLLQQIPGYSTSKVRLFPSPETKISPEIKTLIISGIVAVGSGVLTFLIKKYLE